MKPIDVVTEVVQLTGEVEKDAERVKSLLFNLWRATEKKELSAIKDVVKGLLDKSWDLYLTATSLRRDAEKVISLVNQLTSELSD